MALDWFHRRGFEHRRCGNYSDRRPHERKGPRWQPTSSVSLGAEEHFEECCDTHGDCCCAVETRRPSGAKPKRGRRMNATTVEIPARRGKAAHVARGQDVLVINTHGEQVVDTWAFNRDDLGEFMSMEHTRAHTLRLVPQVGDILRTNRRRPILTLVEDTSGGVHDTL